MDRLAQGVTNRSHRCTETEDQRIQDSHSQPHARFSTFFLRGTDEYRPVAAGTRRPQAAAAVSPRWRRPKQFSRPRGCICATRSFQLAVVVSFRFARDPTAIREIIRSGLSPAFFCPIRLYRLFSLGCPVVILDL